MKTQNVWMAIVVIATAVFVGMAWQYITLQRQIATADCLTDWIKTATVASTNAISNPEGSASDVWQTEGTKMLDVCWYLQTGQSRFLSVPSLEVSAPATGS
jgi:hypothetical protein